MAATWGTVAKSFWVRSAHGPRGVHIEGNTIRIKRGAVGGTRDTARMAPSRRRAETCDHCGRPIDDCACVCPFCGQTDGCECAIGTDVAAGGD